MYLKLRIWPFLKHKWIRYEKSYWPCTTKNILFYNCRLLNGNQISGPLPDELGNLRNLIMFQVDQNKISGPIPKSLANMTNVLHLWVTFSRVVKMDFILKWLLSIFLEVHILMYFSVTATWATTYSMVRFHPSFLN